MSENTTNDNYNIKMIDMKSSDVFINIVPTNKSIDENITENLEIETICENNCEVSLLHRLINSDVCDILMILNYLHNLKEIGIKEFICNKLFEYNIDDLKLYLSQIINILIYNEDCLDFLKPLLITKSQTDPIFSLMCIWELENHLLNLKTSDKHSQAINEIHKQILTIQVINSEYCEYPSISPKHLRINPTEPIFSNQAPPFIVERSFVFKLLTIGEKLRLIKESTEKHSFLLNELIQINNNLPDKRIYIPWLHIQPHFVLQIDTEHFIILNSKTKAPFLIFIEISYIDQANFSPPKISDNHVNQTISLENTSGHSTTGSSDTYQLDENTHPVFVENIPYETNSYGSKDSQEYINASQIRDSLGGSIQSIDQGSIKKRIVQFNKINEMIEEKSKFKNYNNRSIITLIVKTGEDLRQEFLASQLLFEFQKIWKLENIPVWIKPFEILTASLQGGFIECINDALSIDQIKKMYNVSLAEYFIEKFGPFDSELCFEMRKNFARSCAAYCVVQYILSLKDRHNGNIMIDLLGHIIHIDFGFMLGSSPRGIGFEMAPFKLSYEMMEVLGKETSEHFILFRSLLLHSFFALRKHHDRIITLVSIISKNSNYPCFQNSNAMKALQYRFHLGLNDEQLTTHIDSLISKSIKSTTSRVYDTFQYYTNGIL